MFVFSAVTSNEINRRNFEDPDGSPPLRLPSLEDTFDTPSAVSFAGVKYDRPPESVVKLFFQSPKTQRVFVLFIFFLAYAFGGALLFRFIERDDFIESQRVYSELREAFAEEHGFSSDLMLEMESFVRSNYVDLDHNPWTLANSFYFCAQTLTTQGFGFLVPRTELGMIITIPYAFFGIGLTAMLFTNIGESVMKCAKWCLRHEKDRNCRKRKELLSLFVSFIITLGLGAFWYQMTEGWTWTESIYFMFIAASTIGYGDVYPEETNWVRACYMPVALITCITLLTYIAAMELETLNAAVSKTAKLTIVNSEKSRRKSSNFTHLKDLKQSLLNSDRSRSQSRNEDEELFAWEFSGDYDDVESFKPPTLNVQRSRGLSVNFEDPETELVTFTPLMG